MVLILLYMNSYPRRQCSKLLTGLIRFRIGSSGHGNEHSCSIKTKCFLNRQVTANVLRRTMFHGDEFLGFLRIEVNVLDGSSETLGFWTRSLGGWCISPGLFTSRGKGQDTCPSCLHPFVAAHRGNDDGKEENQCRHSAVWQGYYQPRKKLG